MKNNYNTLRLVVSTIYILTPVARLLGFNYGSECTVVYVHSMCMNAHTADKHIVMCAYSK